MDQNNIKEETHTTPACCLTCGSYKPQFFNQLGKECAVFGNTKGVKWERCGAWSPRCISPDYRLVKNPYKLNQ